MNIWDPIWKEDKEDADISTLVYKMKPVSFDLSDINLSIYGSEGSYLLSAKLQFDIQFKEDYINTLDLIKRTVWVVDDGGCIVRVNITNNTQNAIVDYVEKLNNFPAQRHWVAKRIKRGIRLEIDMPRSSAYPPIYNGSLKLQWQFGSVKLLVPEPMQIDSTTIETTVGFVIRKLENRNIRPMGQFMTPMEYYEQVSNRVPYKLTPRLHLLRPDMVTIEKFTIESSKNLVNELKDVVSVPMDTYDMSYSVEEHPTIPIKYAKSSTNRSIGSSFKPKENSSKKVDPILKNDQTHLRGRSLTSLGIVKKILSIIKRRKREIK